MIDHRTWVEVRAVLQAHGIDPDRLEIGPSAEGAAAVLMTEGLNAELAAGLVLGLMGEG